MAVILVGETICILFLQNALHNLRKEVNPLQQEYILKKEVDWSTLNKGISIPTKLQTVFYDSIASNLAMGESKFVKILIGGEEFTAKLVNNSFDRQKYPKHKEMLQIRYTENTPIAKFMQQYFSNIYAYAKVEKELNTNKRKPIKIPDELKGYVYIYATAQNDTFLFECVTNQEIILERETTEKMDEVELETLLNRQDTSAHIENKVKNSKIRHLDITISNKLKSVYDYRCQVCGEKIGEKYSADFIHAHHIEPFSTSLNNNPDNIMILCPNHHGIIHVAKPEFNNQKKLFLYPNGLEEGLILNKHL